MMVADNPALPIPKNPHNKEDSTERPAHWLYTFEIDLRQVIYALGRAERRLQAEADALHDAGDYAAEIPAADAARMREAVVLLRQMMTPNAD